MEKESFILRACDSITKYSIYALIFLVPIFFLPWTTDVLDFNKQALLVLLVFISLFALMLKILISGKFEITKSRIHIVAGALFLMYLLATIFSVNRYGSFWGQPQQVSESLLTAICLLIFYFIVSNIFTKKDIFTSILIIACSAIVAQLVGVSQLLGLFIIPFGFAKSATFNLAGSVGSLGFISAILIPLATAMLIITKKWWRVLFASQLVLSGLILFLINYPIIWWVVIVGSALTLILGTAKRDIFDGRWMALPMFFLAVSLFFVLLNVQIGWLPQSINEVFLSPKTGLSIGLQAIKERPIFGSGLGTFAYDFSKFKDPSFSASSLWNITFNKSSSKVLTSLATTGVLGLLALLALMAFPIFYVIRFLFATKEASDSSSPEKSKSQIQSILLLGISVAIVEQSLAYFLYNSNVALDFLFFFMIAALVGLIFEDKKKYVLKQSSLLTLIVTFIFTLVFIFGIGILILNGQRYVAEINYYQGLADYQANQNAAGLIKLESAVNLNQGSDLYLRQLSQAYLLNLKALLQGIKTAPTDQQKTQIQTLEANSVNAGKVATDLNPKDANNWSSHGYVCQSLIGILNGADTCAISSYDSALKLDPNNPYFYFQEGSVYLADAINSSADQKNQLLAKAQGQLEKAISLNPNYSDALYSLGIVYDSLGQNSKAVDVFTKLQQLNPSNTDIPKILANLKSGLSALQTAPPPTENPLSGTPGAIENPPASSTSNTAKPTKPNQ